MITVEWKEIRRWLALGAEGLFIHGVALPPKWRKLRSCLKLVERESLGAVFLVLTCSTMTGM